MKNKYKILATSVATILFTNAASAATYAIEARSDAMGGVGTVSATYLTAPFFNPALTAIYRRNDDAGMIVPSFGGSYDDQYDLVDEIERISKLTDVDEIKKSMDAIDGKRQTLILVVSLPLVFPTNSYLQLHTVSYTLNHSYNQMLIPQVLIH